MTESRPRVAIVTGSTRGIGRAAARALVDNGWIVGITGRDAGAVDSAVASLGDRARPLPFDVTDSASSEHAVLRFAKEHARLDALVHCAGIMKDAPIGMISELLVREVLDTNVIGTINVLQPVLRVMTRQGSGAVVLFGSIVGADGSAGQTVYAASKAAITGLVKSAAKEVARRGVRVNGIEPGTIRTDLLSGFSPAKLELLAGTVPLGRLGDAAEVAELAVFLVSDRSSYVTGQVIRVDGGLSL